MSDVFWANVRYALIALGVAIVVKYSGGIFNEGTATSLVSPLVDVIIGVLMAGGSAIWGNIVKSGTKAVPNSAAKNIATVSPVSGKVIKPD